MKIKVTPKVMHSTFFASLLEFRPDLKNVPFPEQYAHAWTHYKNYINDDNNNSVGYCIIQDYKQFKQQFELCHYLDDKQYLQYCISQYLVCIYNANCEVLNYDHNKQNKEYKQITKNKVKQLLDCMLSCHEEFIQTLNVNTQYDIRLLLPYFLLPNDISDVFFDTWLQLNHNKKYVLCDNIMVYHHTSKLQVIDGKHVLKMFKTGYSLQPLIAYQEHGVLYEWDTTRGMKTIGYYTFGIKHGLTHTWHNGILCQEIQHINGKIKHHKSWYPRGNINTYIEFYEYSDLCELITYYEDGTECNQEYINYKYYTDHVHTIFI